MKNPVCDAWYADPESRVFGDTLYCYVTRSLPFDEQLNLDVVTSTDLEHFTVHRDVLDMTTFSTAHRAVWAPSAMERNGKFYIVFAANNIHSEDEVGGLYIGVSPSPLGPFKNVLADGKPFLNRIYCGAQPIDAHFFCDDDGTVYLYYGGWRHLAVGKLNETMDGFLPMEEPSVGGVVREVTPEGYVEAPYVEKIGGKYHLMYSSGNWTNGTYRVKAAVSDTPCGKFEWYGDVLVASPLADGPGHNSAFFFGGRHYTAYHRRTVGDTYAHHRRLCIDLQTLDGDRFNPVEMT